MATAGGDSSINAEEAVVVHTPTQLPVRRAVMIMVAIVVVTAVMWTMAGLTYNQYMPSQMSLLVISYTLGLRHALDADHVAAIDNVTRRFTQEDKSYLTVGTFFSLGHSTIVIIATVLVAALSSTISSLFNKYNAVSGSIGSIIAASFLLLIATINGVCMVLLVKDIRQERNRIRRQIEKRNVEMVEAHINNHSHGIGNGIHNGIDNGIDNSVEAGQPQLQLVDLSPADPSGEDSLVSDDKGDAMRWDKILENSGFLTRLFGQHLFTMIDRPWKMYYVGFLFGLGFDTATEVALLGIAALHAVSGTPSWLILFLPLLFTAGMVLVDTADGILMSGT